MKRTNATLALVYFSSIFSFLSITIPSMAQVPLPWGDDFEAYTTGTDLHNMNGWFGWGNDPAFSSLVTNTPGPTNIVDIAFNDDLVAFFTPATTGQWSVRACQFIPTGMTGASFFILMNQYDHAGATWNWSAQVQFDGATGNMIDDSSLVTMPFVTNTWAEIRVEIDLDADTQEFFYNGTLFYSGVWNGYQSGPGTGSNAIEALDLFSNAASSVFYDHITILQGPGSSANCPGALPVEIGSFDSYVKDGVVDLQWTTLSEDNNSGFEVEMSTGHDFNSMGWVEGNGSSTELNTYNFQIRDLEPGSYSFRLKQIDFDGAFEYSDVVEAVVTVPEGYLISDAYPNPFNPSTSIQIGVEESQFVSLKVYNSVGQLVASPFGGEIAANQMQTVNVRLDGLPSGQYILAVNGSNWTTHKVITMTK